MDIVTLLHVITSYSIHYTKLYEELAEVNRAALSYEPRGGGGSIFRIIFSDPQRWET